MTTHGATPCVCRAPGGQSTLDLQTERMVCHKGKTAGEKRKKRLKGREEMATQKKTQKKNILKQYRKLIAVLPNICSKSRVTKVKDKETTCFSRGSLKNDIIEQDFGLNKCSV